MTPLTLVARRLAFLVVLTVVAVAAPQGAPQRMEPGSGSAAQAASQAGALPGAPHDPAFVPAAGLADVRPVGLPLAPRTESSPAPSGAIGSALLGGYATWYDACRRCAAAGPQLRAMLGSGWRGTAIEVGGPGGASVTVVLSDACACGERHGLPTLIDLSADAFAELAPLDWGIVAISIEVAGPLVTLPPTDTD